MAELKDYTILLVPGFLTQIYTAVGEVANAASTEKLIEKVKTIPKIGNELASYIPKLKLPMDPDFARSFAAQEESFHNREIFCVDMGDYPGFSTQDSVEANGQVLRKVLGDLGDRKFLIVSHSKGGLDTLEALIAADEAQLARVHGWYSIQAPFFGSPVADEFPSPLSEALMKALGGDGRALDDLKTGVRKDYMSNKQDAINGVIRRIPIRCAFGTYRARPGDQFANAARQLAADIFDLSLLKRIAEMIAYNAVRHPFTQIAHDISDAMSLISARFNQIVKEVMGQFGLLDLTNLSMTEPNDGLVPASSAVLPGVEGFELVPNVDHAGAVMNATPFRNFWNASERVHETDAELLKLLT